VVRIYSVAVHDGEKLHFNIVCHVDFIVEFISTNFFIFLFSCYYVELFGVDYWLRLSDRCHSKLCI